MSTALMVQLLEEAAERCTQLTDHADAAEKEVAQIIEGAHALGDLAAHELDSLHQAMTAAMEAIGHAQEQIESEAGRVGTAIEAIPARADASEAAVRALLAAVHEDATHLDELRVRLMARADEATQHSEADLNDLLQKVHDYQERIDTRLDEASAEVELLQKAVEDGRSRLSEEEQKAREAIQSLAVMAVDKAHAFAAGLHAILLILGRKTVEFCNHVVEAHNLAVVGVRTEFTDEVPSGPAVAETWLHLALQPIRDALEELALLPQPAEEALSDAASGIVEKAEKALNALESIAHALDHGVPTDLPTSGS